MNWDSFVAIDWSGQAVARPKGLAVARADAGETAPELIAPEGGWSRQAILDWLLALAARGDRTLIGLDLSPSFPFVDDGIDAFFPGWAASPPDARSLWQAVDDLCTDDPHLAATSFVAHPDIAPHFRRHGVPAAFTGRGRLRVCEQRQVAERLSPSSCFNLVGAAQVGKSSLTGMRVLHRLRGRIPVWPFDPVPATGPLIVEIYTTIAAREALAWKGRSKITNATDLDAALRTLDSAAHAPMTRYTDHATDALVTAAWLRRAAFRPDLWQPAGLAAVARTEGWTFGVR
jgi:hypothetical protein